MKGLKKYLLTLLISITTFVVGINYVNAEGDPGEILLSKTAVKDDVTYGRTATVTLSINSNAFTDTDKTDVVLILDRSTSMDGTKMSNTKSAAKDLIDSIINNNTKNKFRAAIVTYGTELLSSYTSSALTNNASTLKGLIDSIPNNLYNQGTNIHAGLVKANSLLSSSPTGTKKIVILLSDGIPTFYIGTDNDTCGNGQNDNYDSDWGCTVNGNNKPSTVANATATTMKSSGIDIYTVGFNISNNNAAKNFLKDVSSDPDSTYSHLATNYSDLVTVFNNMVKSFTVVATNATVVDTVPKGFQIKDGTLPSGATAVVNSDGTTTITWNVGDVDSSKTQSLSYVVEAKDNEYGSMYTNVSATLTATSANGNPKYGSSNPVTIDFEKPYVPIPGVTVDDNYTTSDTYFVKQGTTLTVEDIYGILSNDKLEVKNLDESATVVDRIVLVEDTASTAGDLNNITINETTGAFTFKADQNDLGNVTYKYYVETTVTVGGVSTIVKSNTSTITLKVIKYPTTYTVNYLEKNTNKVLSNSKNGTGNAFENITEEAININGYNKVNPTSQTITLNKENNVINFYYEKRTDLSYTVYYKEVGTEKELADAKEVTSQTFGSSVTENAIEINGYNKVNPTTSTIEITTGENEITFYYEAKEINYIVNYFLKGTSTKIKDSKNLKAIFGTKVESSLHIEEIFGYKYDSSNVDELLITTNEETNVINLYYVEIKGSVKAIYVDENGNEISESIITEGRIGTEYKTSVKEINKYIFREVSGNENGTYTEEEIVVTYVYETVPNTGLFENNISMVASVISIMLFTVLTYIKKKIFN